MSGTNAAAGDEMIRRLGGELREKENMVRSIFERDHPGTADENTYALASKLNRSRPVLR